MTDSPLGLFITTRSPKGSVIQVWMDENNVFPWVTIQITNTDDGTAEIDQDQLADLIDALEFFRD